MKRHTRAHVREQRSRWIWKRIRKIRTEWPKWSDHPDAASNWGRPLGMLNKKDPWDCGRTQCGICRHGGHERRDLRERAAVDCQLIELNEMT